MHASRVLLALLALGMYARPVKADKCVQYPAAPAPAPENSRPGPIMSVVTVPDAFPLSSVTVVNFKLQAARIGSLKVSLSAGTPGGVTNTVVLKDIRSGGASTQMNAAFEDAATAAVPAAGIATVPLSGAYSSAQPLATFTGAASSLAGQGGSEGTWVLRVVDLQDASRPINLQGWTLVLCPASAAEVTAASGPGFTTFGTFGSAPITTTSNPSPSTPSPATPSSPAPIPVPVPSVNTTSANIIAALVAANSTSDDSITLLQQLLTNLDKINPGLGGGSVPTALSSDGPQLMEQVSSRINELLSPYNQSLVVRVATGVNSAINKTLTTATATIANRPTALKVAASAHNGSTLVDALTSFNGGRSTDSSILPAGDGQVGSGAFLNSFRRLITAAAGKADNGTDVNATIAGVRTAMGQSGAGVLDLPGENWIRQAITGKTAKLEAILSGSSVLTYLNSALTLLTSVPILSTKAVQKNIEDDYRSAVTAVATLIGAKKDLGQATFEDAATFLMDYKEALLNTSNSYMDDFKSLVETVNKLVQTALQQRSASAIKAGSTMSSAIADVLGALAKVPGSPLRTTLETLLKAMEASVGGMNANFRVGGGPLKSFFGVLLTYIDTGKIIINNGLKSAVDKTTTQTSNTLGTLNSLLDQVNAALAFKGLSPLTATRRDTYTAAITWLKDRVIPLKNALLGLSTLPLDGSVLKSSQASGSSALDTARAIQGINKYLSLMQSTADPTATPPATAPTLLPAFKAASALLPSVKVTTTRTPDAKATTTTALPAAKATTTATTNAPTVQASG